MNRNVLDDLNKSLEQLEKACHGEGEGAIHSEKWKRCVEHVKEQGTADEPEAVCTASLGQDSYKSFAKSDDLTSEDMHKINMAILQKSVDTMNSLLKSMSIGRPEDAREITVAEMTGNGVMLTPTLDMLYDNSPLPRPSMIFDPADLYKNGG